MTTLNAEQLRAVDEMLYIQMTSMPKGMGDHYMRGMYNGMEFIRCLLTQTEPIYMEEDGTLDREAVERNPERFI